MQGALHYQGHFSNYAAFSLIFLALLLSAFYRTPSFGYMFFVIFLWLGFWLKLVLHAWFSYEYIEPIGAFVSSSAAWGVVA